MSKENFNYKDFTKQLKKQIPQNLPDDIKGEKKTFVIDIVEKYSNIAGKELSEDTENFYTIKQQQFIIQLITEWTFYKAIDVVKEEIPLVFKEDILSHIANAIFVVTKECINNDTYKDEIIELIEYIVKKTYKDKLDELLSNEDISLEVYNSAINQSFFDSRFEEINEDHSSFYQADESFDKEYLNNKILYTQGKELAYRYLVKAAHVLTRHKCKAKDRRKILKFLYQCSEIYITSALNPEINFKKEEIERLLTVGMEIAFHRIVVLYKNNILNDPDNAKDLIDYYATMIANVEIEYIKNKLKLKDVYHIGTSILFNEFKDYLKDWLENDTISKEQYNRICDKSSLIYLAEEIQRLMDVQPKVKPWSFIIFIIIWLIYVLAKVFVGQTN